MLPRQPHSPITGDNATRHSSGGHTNAILKNPLAYQPFEPAQIGSKIDFVFGPFSGSNHAKTIIEKAGYICNDDEKTSITQAIKDFYADRRKGITDEELLAAYFDYRSPIKVSEIQYAKQGIVNVLKLKGDFFGQTDLHVEQPGQNSALALLCYAVEKQMPGVVIDHYKSESANGQSINATSHAEIVISTPKKKTYTGIAEDKDIEISALKAYIDAIRNAYIEENFRKEETI